MTFNPEALRTIRIRSGLSLRMLAKRAGMTPGGLSRLESGHRQPRVSTVHRLAQALEVPVTAFTMDE